MANGMIPFADREAVRRAYNALQVPLWNARKTIKAGTNLKRLTGESDKAFKARQRNYLEGNEFYQKLLRLGVVNSQVQLGDLRNLLKDVKFGGITGNVAQNLDSYGLKSIIKNFKKLLKNFQKMPIQLKMISGKYFHLLEKQKDLKNIMKMQALPGLKNFTH